MEPTPAPDPSSLLTALTTEHVALQAARSATVTESVGRSMIHLGSLSASLIALALVAQSESTADDFRLCALVILPALLFLGAVTFARLVELGIEDAISAQAIGRIRRFYLDLAGSDARFFLLGGHDDVDGSLANMGLRDSRWRPFLSVASVIALINSMVSGALVGVALDAFAPTSMAVVAALVVVALGLGAHYRLGLGRFAGALRQFEPLFPTGSPSR